MWNRLRIPVWPFNSAQKSFPIVRNHQFRLHSMRENIHSKRRTRKKKNGTVIYPWRQEVSQLEWWAKMQMGSTYKLFYVLYFHWLHWKTINPFFVGTYTYPSYLPQNAYAHNSVCMCAIAEATNWISQIRFIAPVSHVRASQAHMQPSAPVNKMPECATCSSKELLPAIFLCFAHLISPIWLDARTDERCNKSIYE